MKALITAGGRGTRLRPLTFTLNKHLIPIANKPMIAYAIEKVAAAGIHDIGIITNPGEVELREVLGRGDAWGVGLTYLEQHGGALGLAHALGIGREFVGNSPCIFYLGDNLLVDNLSSIVKEFEERGSHCHFNFAKVKDPQRFGVPEFAPDGALLRVIEKPDHPPSDLAQTGVYLYQPDVWPVLEDLRPGRRGEYEISDFNSLLIERGFKASYSIISGWWKDTGLPQDLLEGNQLIMSDPQSFVHGNQGVVSDSATVQGKVNIGTDTAILGTSFIRGPVLIGQNCHIEDSYIGPFAAIGDNVTVQNTELEHSIVMSGAKIEAPVRIVDSILGRNCRIQSHQATRPSGHKLIVGDFASVEL
ncbi:glucose-1-phosphate thymidylyltransferase [Candidatus Parcubacteria bacterium]|nr:glucose-1-phosphate thymidylyltransferase [Candidatus Parcubacteria bacterium]